MHSDDYDLDTPPGLLAALRDLRRCVVAERDELLASWGAADSTSLENLATYLVLRRRDLRRLQERLAGLGLAALHSARSDALAEIDALIFNLALRCGESGSGEASRKVIPVPEQRSGPPELMVTLPEEAAHDAAFVQRLVEHGMTIARINCAHDDADSWLAMVRQVRAAAAKRNRTVRISFEVAGNKLRTGEVQIARGHKRVRAGDTLLLVRDAFLSPAEFPTQARVTAPEALLRLRVGDPVWIDDGHAGGGVEAVLDAGVLVRVHRARIKGARIRPNKGLNFPQTPVDAPLLTERDRAHLDLLLKQTDMVGFPFVQSAADLRAAQVAVRGRLGATADRYPVIAKIETPLGVRNLPEIIAAAAGRHPLWVMIARGDLGVELGFEGLADAQETIQDLCAAARVPVIWATEVLGHFVKQGTHTRGELTDAALGTLADCVMLNKGPFICEALDCLRTLAVTTRAHRERPATRLAALDLGDATVAPPRSRRGTAATGIERSPRQEAALRPD